jgi:hypothetical protein
MQCTNHWCERTNEKRLQYRPRTLFAEAARRTLLPSGDQHGRAPTRRTRLEAASDPTSPSLAQRGYEAFRNPPIHLHPCASPLPSETTATKAERSTCNCKRRHGRVSGASSASTVDVGGPSPAPVQSCGPPSACFLFRRRRTRSSRLRMSEVCLSIKTRSFLVLVD